VLLLFDAAPHLIPGGNYAAALRGPDFEAEAHVYRALKNLGHEVRPLAIFEDAGDLLKELRRNPPDLVFNQVEQFNGDSAQEKNLIGLLEMLGIPFTGTGSVGMTLAKNKALAKEVLSHHGIPTPPFQVYPLGSAPTPPTGLRYPLIVKPLREEASYGIARTSFVEADASFRARVRFIHEAMAQDAMAEEYVAGRELYVGVLGNQRPQAFPPRELIFSALRKSEPRIATFKAKWDEKYRKRWGIKNRFAVNLSQALQEKIQSLCKKVYRHLYLSGYARLDWRLTAQNELVFLEANPNPFLANYEDFACSAAKAGLGYDQLIERIVQHALNHNK
jgi:D-alanine-D-alanine ligase